MEGDMILLIEKGDFYQFRINRKVGMIGCKTWP